VLSGAVRLITLKSGGKIRRRNALFANTQLISLHHQARMECTAIPPPFTYERINKEGRIRI
jgi:hypothetical protein